MVKAPDNKNPDDFIGETQRSDEPIENYHFIKKETVLGEIWNRRVPHILGLYLGGSWGILEFISSLLVDRFFLSSHWITLSFVTLASLIPSVMMVAWYHGKPGPDSWTNIEKIGIPINVLITLILVAGLFNGKDLGAVTQSVQVINRDGETVERLLPKNAYRKSMAVFAFQPAGNSTDSNWLQMGIGEMLFRDLRQDLFINVRSPYDFIQTIHQKGFTYGSRELPLALLREICVENSIAYIVTGNYYTIRDSLHIKVDLYNSNKLKHLRSVNVSGKMLPELVDKISDELKTGIDMPARYSDAFEDMPAGEIVTRNMSAYENYILGLNAINFNNDAQLTSQYIRTAIDKDPTFALAYLALVLNYLRSNDNANLHLIYPKLMENLYKLSGFDRFYVKYLYYLNNQEYAKATEILDFWKKAFPDDIRPYQLMGQNHYHNSGNYQEEIREYQKILAIDPNMQNFILQIAPLYTFVEQFDSAEFYYLRYNEQNPEKSIGHIKLAGFFLARGDFDKSIQELQRAELLDPERSDISLAQAETEARQGDFKQAEHFYSVALNRAKTAQDSVQTLRNNAEYHIQRGEVAAALRDIVNYEQIAASFESPYRMLTEKMGHIQLFVWLKEDRMALDIIEKMKNLWSAVGDYYLLGEYNYVLAKEDLVQIELTIQKLEHSNLKELFSQALDGIAEFGRGKAEDLRQNPEAAILHYEKSLSMPDLGIESHLALGKCYRLSGDLKNSENHLNAILRTHPADGMVHYELAQLYWDWNKKDKAMTHMNICLGIWEHADDYSPYTKEAQGMLRRWKILL